MSRKLKIYVTIQNSSVSDWIWVSHILNVFENGIKVDAIHSILTDEDLKEMKDFQEEDDGE